MGKSVWTIRQASILFLAIGAMFALSPRIMAQTANTHCASNVTSSKQVCGCALTDSVAFSSGSENENQTTTSAGSNQNDWVHRWMRTVDKARASQPHFVSPIVTTHVMLVQKYRAFSAPEGQGDYFVGFFFGGSFPTGTPPNGSGHPILSPTFAAAKGVGPWDIQSTIGASLPATGANLLGRMILFNTAVDYRIKGKIWPMLEQNSTFWSGGNLDGRKQTFLTPGLVLGGFPLAERLHISFGTGVQIAVTQFHQFNHRWIVSVRFPF